LDIFSYESRFYLGAVQAIPQYTPTVTDVEPVISALENSSIVVLKNHGVVSVGEDFKSAFGLMEVLEEQAKVNLAVKGTHVSGKQGEASQSPGNKEEAFTGKKYKLLSQAHSERLMEIVNADQEAQDLGKQYGLTCTLAVKNMDSGDVACFYYDNGKILKVDNSEETDFLIAGKENILRKVFNREIDPFVAATQGKVETKGDFAKISKWYPVMVRTFKLWAQVPVE